MDKSMCAKDSSESCPRVSLDGKLSDDPMDIVMNDLGKFVGAPTMDGIVRFLTLNQLPSIVTYAMGHHTIDDGNSNFPWLPSKMDQHAEHF